MSIHPIYIKILKLSGSLFCYGFAREMRSEYPKEMDLLGNRVAFSLVNGIRYASPFALGAMFDLLNRADIALTHKNKQDYAQGYKECIGTNWNVIL